MLPSPWPNGAQAAVSFTVDNLGEAQEITSGTWPSEKPIGQHFSVIDVLPRMLQIFDDYDIKITFFFETWSLGIYPDVAQEVISRGHELAWHGFKHETWTKLSSKEEELNFTKSFAETAKLSVQYKGFRPPGGLINDTTYDLLQKNSIRYISPAAEKPAVVRGLAVLPFHWKTVDAFYYMKEFSGLRLKYGTSENVLDPLVVKERIIEQVKEAKKCNGYISVLFHPILQTSEDRLRIIEEVVEWIRNDPSIWCAPCSDVADWVLKNPDSFGSDPAWINETW